MKDSTGLRARLQRFGEFLTNMVLPNIGAFIAWGLLTALFIPSGWMPNENMAAIVDPTIRRSDDPFFIAAPSGSYRRPLDLWAPRSSNGDDRGDRTYCGI